MKSFLTVFFATSLLCLSARAQSVRVVDAANGPGTAFQSLETAIQSAASGDVLLVRSGDYEVLPSVTIGKSLVIQADSGATVRVNAGLIVQGLPAGERVVVRNLTLGGVATIILPGPAIQASNCQGSLWFEDCSVPGPGVLASSSGGAWITDCASVVFSRCTFGPSFDNLVSSQNFITVRSGRSIVHLYGCTVLGADGMDTCNLASGATPAIQVSDGELWITGSEITGGQGSDGGHVVCMQGGPGACGLVLAGTNPRVFVTDSRITGGAGGTGFGGAPDGLTPAPIQTGVGQVIQIPGAARRLSASALLRDDQSTVLSVHGAPGDQVWLVYSPRPGPRILLPSNRPLLLAAPYSVIPLGTLDASGTKGLVVGPRDLGPGTEAASFHLQALFWNTTLHQRAWSAPSHLQVVDAAF